MKTVGLIAAALLFTLAYGQAQTLCEPGYHAFGKLCYRFHPPMNHPNARHSCHESDAQLVSIHDEALNNFIAGLGEEVMIGLFRQPRGVQWDDGTNVDYTNYADNFVYLADYFGNCAKIVNGKWVNMECELDKAGFVCEKDPLNISSAPKDKCSNQSIYYMDEGKLYSPGYPEYYDGTHELHCQYKLVSKIGTNILIKFFNVEMMSEDDSIKVYDSWTPSKESLIATVPSGTFYKPMLTNGSHFMLVQFEGVTTGAWRAEFSTFPYDLPATDEPTTERQNGSYPEPSTPSYRNYTRVPIYETTRRQNGSYPEPTYATWSHRNFTEEPIFPSTTRRQNYTRVSTTPAPLSSCPSSDIRYPAAGELKSPDYPMGYAGNLGCSYRIRINSTCTSFSFPEINISSDDELLLVTYGPGGSRHRDELTNADEGKVDFYCTTANAIDLFFSSGRQPTPFNHWRITYG